MFLLTTQADHPKEVFRAFSIVTDYGLDGQKFDTRLGINIFFHRFRVQTGIHSVSYPMGTWAPFLGGGALTTGQTSVFVSWCLTSTRDNLPLLQLSQSNVLKITLTLQA
jgi:hypothetical protein